MRKANTQILIGIVILTLFALWVDWPQKPTNYLPNILPWPQSQGVHLRLGDSSFDRQGTKLGLDLQGGTFMVLQADLSKVPAGEQGDRMKGVVQIIERRINAYGVGEPVIQLQGNDRVAVQLPGVKDIDEAKRLIGQTAQLEFKEKKVDEQGNVTYVSVGLTGADLTKSYPSIDQTYGPVVNFEFNDKGAQIFGDLTTRIAPLGGQIAVYLDQDLLTDPRVDEPILGGRGFIRGNFTVNSAQTLAIQLNSGALPVPVSVISQRDVDATLGADSVQKSILAGAIGLGVVMLFMIIHYRLPGLLANAALLMYALFVLAVFKLVPITLTLAGIAGFILSIGMAVDANILIFERVKEELRAGRTLAGGIEAGFGRAWTSIRDSNVSTIITCGILYWFGNNFGASLVMGFAVTLFLGVVISMFTAITITRSLLRAIIDSGKMPSGWLFGLEKEQGITGEPDYSVR
ncbi:MAG: protein translocase subunit SecD [Dehalococcoidia bacterium]|nr:protein translocase subunit SecD [Dehalococcoidia bacterium]